MKLTGKTVFITGGASGIGKATVEAVLQEGAKAVIADINEKAGEELAASLQDKYGKHYVIFIQCDVTDKASFTGAFREAVEKFGHVDVMVNNAGIADEKNWEHLVTVNFIGVVIGTQLAMDHMRKDYGGKGGVLIATSSILGLIPSFICPVYTATKHALVGYFKSLAEAPDLHKIGIRFGVICPDFTETPLLAFPPDHVLYYDVLVKMLQTGRPMLAASRVAEGILKLVADDDSNGAILPVTRDELTYQTPVLKTGINTTAFVDFMSR